VSGRINLTIDDTTCQVAHGDSRCSHSNVEHLAVAQEDSIAVEALSPRREYYIP
jgi:quercetin dioxygenase-like cupin family protein